MAQARQLVQWQQTAALLALQVNLNRDPAKSKPVTAEQFIPPGLLPQNYGSQPERLTPKEAVALFGELAGQMNKGRKR